MKAPELRQLTYEELLAELDDAKEAQFNLRFQKTSGQLEDLSQLRTTRRRIARIMTILREKELEAESNE